MVAETTVNIRIDMLAKLARAADYTGTSKSRLISALLRYAAQNKRMFLPDAIRVRYQERRGERDWHRLHVCIRRDEFEFYHDLRCLCKFSVSFLIAYAIERYLDEVIRLLMKDTDNYRYQNYAIYQVVDYGVICWVRCWGIPPRMLPHQHRT
jgi:hypothetical protein